MARGWHPGKMLHELPRNGCTPPGASLVPLKKERIKTAHAKHNWVEAIFSAGEEIDEHGRTTGSLLLVERGEDRIGRYDTFDDG